MKLLRNTAITSFIVLLVYLVPCIIFALRPAATGGPSPSSRTFTLDRPMDEVLAEYADHLRRQYGSDIAVDVKGTTLTYAISFPTPNGYDDVTDTITLGHDPRFGEGACKLTSNLVVKKRSAPFLLAPVHFLANGNKKVQSGSITHELINKLTSASNNPDVRDDR